MAPFGFPGKLTGADAAIGTNILNTSWFESGVQVSELGLLVKLLTLAIAPVFNHLIYIWLLPSRFDMKASRCPSGETTGE